MRLPWAGLGWINLSAWVLDAGCRADDIGVCCWRLWLFRKTCGNQQANGHAGTRAPALRSDQEGSATPLSARSREARDAEDQRLFGSLILRGRLRELRGFSTR